MSEVGPRNVNSPALSGVRRAFPGFIESLKSRDIDITGSRKLVSGPEELG